MSSEEFSTQPPPSYLPLDSSTELQFHDLNIPVPPYVELEIKCYTSTGFPPASPCYLTSVAPPEYNDLPPQYFDTFPSLPPLPQDGNRYFKIPTVPGNASYPTKPSEIDDGAGQNQGRGRPSDLTYVLLIVLSCISFWLCGIYLGCMGFFLAVDARNAAANGDLETARKRSKISFILSITSFLIGAIVIVAVVASIC